MNICGNSASHGWGTAGANGAQVTFSASDQTLDGDIVVDTISTLDMTYLITAPLTERSTLSIMPMVVLLSPTMPLLRLIPEAPGI